MKMYKFEILNANHLCKRKTKKPLAEIIKDLEKIKEGVKKS